MAYTLSDVKIDPTNTDEENEDNQISVKSPVQQYVPLGTNLRIGTESNVQKLINLSQQNDALGGLMRSVGGGIKNIGQAYNWITEPLKYAATDPSKTGSGEAILGTLLMGAEDLTRRGGRGAEMWATGADLQNPITKQSMGNLPRREDGQPWVDPTVARTAGEIATGALIEGGFAKGVQQLGKLSKTLKIADQLTPSPLAVTPDGLRINPIDNIQNPAKPLMIKGSSNIAKVPANQTFKTSKDWYAKAKQLSKEGFNSKEIMQKIGIYDDVKAGKRWTIHKDHDGITRVNLNNRDLRAERNLRRAAEQTGDRLNAYKSKILDAGPGTNVHHMRPKKVIDVILNSTEGVNRQVLIDLAHDVFGGIGDTLGNLQQLSKPLHDQVHAKLLKAGWDHRVMDPKKFKAMSMTERVEAFYDFREAVQEINSWVIKQKQLGN